MKFIILCSLVLCAVFYFILGAVDSFGAEADKWCKQESFRIQNPELCEVTK